MDRFQILKDEELPKEVPLDEISEGPRWARKHKLMIKIGSLVFQAELFNLEIAFNGCATVKTANIEFIWDTSALLSVPNFLLTKIDLRDLSGKDIGTLFVQNSEVQNSIHGAFIKKVLLTGQIT